MGFRDLEELLALWNIIPSDRTQKSMAMRR